MADQNNYSKLYSGATKKTATIITPLIFSHKNFPPSHLVLSSQMASIFLVSWGILSSSLPEEEEEEEEEDEEARCCSVKW